MEKVSLFTHLLFTLSTAFVLFQLFKATHRSGLVLAMLIAWAILTAILGVAGFYRQGYQVPPRFLFLIGPGVVLILLLFFTRRGKSFLDTVDIPDLTLLQTVRVPVEITLFQLYGASLIPQIMTFEGKNFDMLTGLTAPVVYYLVFRKKALRPNWLLVWNFICLILLFTIMGIAILSLETPFQQFGFGQPNIGVTYFPFVWLPGIIVPAALFSHLASIRRLLVRQHPHTDKQRDLFFQQPG